MLLQIGEKLYYKQGNFLLPIGASLIKKFGATSFYCKLGQVLLQIRAAIFIKNWGKCYYILGQLNYYKSGQLLQIRATFITNWGSYYKLRQTLLQISAAITNMGITKEVNMEFLPLAVQVSKFQETDRSMPQHIIYHSPQMLHSKVLLLWLNTSQVFLFTYSTFGFFFFFFHVAQIKCNKFLNEYKPIDTEMKRKFCYLGLLHCKIS